MDSLDCHCKQCYYTSIYYTHINR